MPTAENRKPGLSGLPEIASLRNYFIIISYSYDIIDYYHIDNRYPTFFPLDDAVIDKPIIITRNAIKSHSHRPRVVAVRLYDCTFHLPHVVRCRNKYTVRVLVGRCRVGTVHYFSISFEFRSLSNFDL